ncbi:MAG: menaquinone biosynthesis protein [Bacteroidia bacterium]|nr:menaquinone biosynthesis protein [Bacteroidia bacterium]MDW8158838.1 menaquinone biosynthesis protein [Bacteroidia bacterium]
MALKVAAVSYFNTVPFVKGLQSYFTPSELNLLLAPPSQCIRAFKENIADVALVPTGALPDLNGYVSTDGWYVLDKFCIGALEEVGSVFLFAHSPLEQLKIIYLDPHSRTSNGLFKVLSAFYWKQKYLYQNQPDHWQNIHGRNGGIVIGDKAIAIKPQFPYAYDLALAWRQFSFLPFVFAVWVVRINKVPDFYLSKIAQAFQDGLEHKLEWAKVEASRYGFTQDFAQTYYEKYIDFELDDVKKNAIHLYLSYLAQIEHFELPTFRYYWPQTF